MREGPVLADLNRPGVDATARTIVAIRQAPEMQLSTGDGKSLKVAGLEFVQSALGTEPFSPDAPRPVSKLRGKRIIRRRRTASVHSSRTPGETGKPDTPLSSDSGMPPILLASTGTQAAKASTVILGAPSYRIEGSISARARLRRPATSPGGTPPRNSTWHGRVA